MPANQIELVGPAKTPRSRPNPAADSLTLILRRGAIAVVCIAFALSLAAWQVAPRLDWARYRQAISAFATARVGRHVSIDGPIHLALLPRPELTAQGVALADRGDGISARIGALRLSVAIGPLLHGHLVPLSLKLDDPVVTFPWPMPGTMSGSNTTASSPGIPAVAQGFAAEVEGGTLRLGGLTLTGVDAAVQADPDTGAFSATGTAIVQGGADATTSRFTAFIGAEAADGSARLSLTLDGMGRLAGAGAVFQGRRQRDGTIDGTLRAEGPDAASLLPAPALPWRAQGRVAAGSGQVRAPDLLLWLGTSPGRAAVALRIAPPARLDVTAAVGQLPLGPWVERATDRPASLPIHLDLSADAARLLGGTLRHCHVALLVAPDRTIIERADTILPGGAAASLAGAITPGHGGESLTGTVRVHAPDARATLVWLQPVLPAPIPPDLVRQAEVAADLALSRGAAALTHLNVTADGAVLQGQASATTGASPSLRADLAADNIDATAWWPHTPTSPERIAAAFRNVGHLAAALNLNVAHLTVPGATFSQVTLDARSDGSGVTLNRLAADLPGAHADAAAKIAADGTIAEARLNLDAPEAASLPSSWRRLPGLWRGPLHVAVSAAGPPARIALQARADLGDLRTEIEGVLDGPARALSGTATLRHPGAPRLLLAAGLAGAGSWLEQGSVAVIAHFDASPRRLDVHDFSVAAATLQLGGQASLDIGGFVPSFEARIDAPRLALPAFDPSGAAPLPYNLLAGWQGQLHLSAAQVLSDLSPVATHLEADVAVAGGLLAASALRADIAGGTLHAEAALDTSSASLSAEGALQGASLNQLGAWPPWTWADGTADLSFSLAAAGHSLDAFLASAGGTGAAALHDAALPGIDLPRLTQLLGARGKNLRLSLLDALSGGTFSPLSGTVAVTLDHGALTAAAPALAGASGQVELAASLDLPARTEDATLRIEPRVAAPPTVAVRLVGAWLRPHRVVDVADALAWAGAGKKK